MTTFFAVPTIFSAILDFITSKKLGGFKNLKLSVSAGEALPENIGKKWNELTSTHILDGIGSTEMLHIFLSNKNNLTKDIDSIVEFLNKLKTEINLEGSSLEDLLTSLKNFKEDTL